MPRFIIFGQGFVDLTNKQLEVLKLVAQGFIHKEIADKLKIKRKTVYKHVDAIHQKLKIVGCGNSRITHFAIWNNLVKNLYDTNTAPEPLSRINSQGLRVDSSNARFDK